MGFPTITVSGQAGATTGYLITTGTFTAQITGNSDGSVTGTWSFTGTYDDSYWHRSGPEALSGTITGSGGATGPWTLVLSGNGLNQQQATLTYADGQYHLAVTGGFIVNITVSFDYGGNYIYEDQFTFAAQLAVAGAAPSGGAINGTENSDTLLGTTGADSIAAFGGDDTITGGIGNDTINGGAGIDTVTFSDIRANYTVTNQGNGNFTVAHLSGAGAEGTDSLTGVERLQFSDSKLAIDIDGHAGQAYRLYQAAFNRVPDVPGLGFQMHALDLGWTVNNIAGDFIASPEFQATYGSLDNTAFIQLLYQNVLHRVGEDAGVQFHLNELASGQTRADVLAHFSESPENQANVIGQIQNGMVYSYP